MRSRGRHIIAWLYYYYYYVTYGCHYLYTPHPVPAEEVQMDQRASVVCPATIDSAMISVQLQGQTDTYQTGIVRLRSLNWCQ